MTDRSRESEQLPDQEVSGQIEVRQEVYTETDWDAVLNNAKLAQEIVDLHLNNGNAKTAQEIWDQLQDKRSRFFGSMLMLRDIKHDSKRPGRPSFDPVEYFNQRYINDSSGIFPQTMYLRFHPERPIAPEDDMNSEELTTAQVEGKLQIQEKDGRYLLCIGGVPVENIIAANISISYRQIASAGIDLARRRSAEEYEAEALAESPEETKQEKPIDPEKYLADLKKLQEATRLTGGLYKFDVHIPRDKRTQYQTKVDQVCALFNDEENRLKQVSFKTKLLELNGPDETVYDGHFQPKRLGFTNLVGITVINAILHNPGTEIMEMVQIHYPNLEESEDENRKYYIPVDAIKKIVVEVAR
jgi:hypothetical protein